MSNFRGHKLDLALRFFVPGDPVSQGSKTMMPRGGEVGAELILVESGNKRTKTLPGNRLRNWRMTIEQCARAEMFKRRLKPLNGILVVGFCFVLARPKTHVTEGTRHLPKDEQRLKKSAPAFPAVKPDLSKVIRAAEDAMEGVVFKNDSRIVGYRDPAKIYDDDGETGVHLEIWKLCV